MELFDTHCHLNFPDFAADYEQVIVKARSAGVKQMLIVGYDIPSSIKACEIAATDEQIFAAVGIHPADTQNLQLAESMNILEDLVQKYGKKVVAIGETGLDFYQKSLQQGGMDQQMIFLTAQLKLAKKNDLPVIIHLRESDEKLLLTLLEQIDYHKIVIHCCVLVESVARKFWAQDIMTSFTGIVTYKGAQAVLQTAAATPDHLIMLETDAPFLVPLPRTVKRNEPAEIVKTLAKIAQIRGVDGRELAALTTDNARRFFKI